LAEVLAGIAPRSGRIPMYSTLTGQLIDTVELDAGYWYRNLRQTVLFQQATEAAGGGAVFIEVSPHPVLAVALEGTAVGTLRRDEHEPTRFLTSLAEAHVHGVGVDWATVLPQRGHVDLPTYPFQHQRYCPEPWAASRAGTDPADAEFWASVDR